MLNVKSQTQKESILSNLIYVKFNRKAKLIQSTDQEFGTVVAMRGWGWTEMGHLGSSGVMENFMSNLLSPVEIAQPGSS